MVLMAKNECIRVCFDQMFMNVFLLLLVYTCLFAVDPSLRNAITTPLERNSCETDVNDVAYTHATVCVCASITCVRVWYVWAWFVGWQRTDLNPMCRYSVDSIQRTQRIAAHVMYWRTTRVQNLLPDLHPSRNRDSKSGVFGERSELNLHANRIVICACEWGEHPRNRRVPFRRSLAHILLLSDSMWWTCTCFYGKLSGVLFNLENLFANVNVRYVMHIWMLCFDCWRENSGYILFRTDDKTHTIRFRSWKCAWSLE